MTFCKHYDFILVIHLIARFWLEVSFAAEIILSHHFGGCCLPFIVPFTLTCLQRISICWQHVWFSEIYQHTSNIIPCSHFCWHCLLWTQSCEWFLSEQGFLPFMLYLPVWGSWVLMIVLCKMMIFIGGSATCMQRIELMRITASARRLLATLHGTF